MALDRFWDEAEPTRALPIKMIQPVSSLDESFEDVISRHSSDPHVVSYLTHLLDWLAKVIEGTVAEEYE